MNKISERELKELFNSYNTVEPVINGRYVDERDVMYSDCWVSGGKEGGNCWANEQTHYQIAAENSKIFENYELFLMDLDEIVKFSFTLGRQLLDLVKISDDYIQYRDYYGNVTYYRHKSVKLDDIIKVLEKFEVLS